MSFNSAKFIASMPPLGWPWIPLPRLDTKPIKWIMPIGDALLITENGFNRMKSADFVKCKNPAVPISY